MLPVQYSYLGNRLCRYARHANPATTIVTVTASSLQQPYEEAEAKTTHLTHPIRYIAERSSVRAFVRITSAASSRESPATSVSHTNASMPSVAPIPKTNRSSSGSGMRTLRGERASSVHPIRLGRASRLQCRGSQQWRCPAPSRQHTDPRFTAVRGGEGGGRLESQNL